MPTRIMKVTYPEGAELSHSRKSPGDFSPLTRDEDNNLGHVVLQPVDWDDEEQAAGEAETAYIYVDESDASATSQDEMAEMLAALLVLGAVVAIERRSDIALWWRDHAQPTLRSVRHRLRYPQREQVSAVGREATAEAVPEFDANVSQALEGYCASMGSDEARDRLVAALMARRFSEQQLAMVRNARIECPDTQSGVTGALEAVTADELEAGLGQLLERNPSLVESDELAQIGKSLNSKVVVAVPSRRQALRKDIRQLARRASMSQRRRAK